MNMSLLDNALGIQLYHSSKKITPDDIEVAVAFIGGKVSITQIAKAYTKESGESMSSAQAFCRIAVAIREAVKQGIVTIQ